MNYATLAAELANDPAGIVYSALDDEATADALNAATRAGHRDVPVPEIAAYMRLNLLVSTLEDWVASAEAGLAKNAARELLGMVRDPAAIPVRMTRAEVRAATGGMIAALVAAGSPINDTHGDAILALADALVSRASLLGLPPVTPSDVANARRL